MIFQDQKILIVGLGVTGISLARFFSKRGGLITVTDIANQNTLDPHIEALRKMDIRMELGHHRIETFEKSDLIVLSPGVPHTIHPIRRAKEKGVKIWGEIELAYQFIHEPIIAITGTNGKTTTTALIGEILKNAGIKVFVGGNIGRPLIEYVDLQDKAEIVVAEVSSFQLDTIDKFRPKVAILLNITADHLDRYPDFFAYRSSKGRIFQNQHENDFAILNGADPNVRAVVQNIRCKKLFFYPETHSECKGEQAAKIKANDILICNGNKKKEVINLTGIQLVGKHNLENFAAACLAAKIFGTSPAVIEISLRNFKGLSHRLEQVAIKNGVAYYNDSKATNVDSVIRALESFNRPVILIMGGRDKGGDFNTLKGFVSDHAKKLILIGEARNAIESVLGHITSTDMVSSMEEAVSLAAKTASPGDIVLLSPGCASFDMFRSYADRGEVFRKLVEKL